MNQLPLILNIDERHKVTLLIQDHRLYYKAEFLMDSQEWAITETSTRALHGHSAHLQSAE